MQNMDWLEEELGGYEDEYLIFDCPGMWRSETTYYSVSSLLFRRPDRALHSPSFSADSYT